MKKRRYIEQTWFNANSIEYETPDEIFEPLNNEFHFTLDVAATKTNAKCKNYFTEKEDGLSQDWYGVCWMNPPYGRIMKEWVKKAYQEYLKGVTVVSLLPVRSNTNWWHQFILPHAKIRYIKGQVKFKGYSRGLWLSMAVVIHKPKPKSKPRKRWHCKPPPCPECGDRTKHPGGHIYFLWCESCEKSFDVRFKTRTKTQYYYESKPRKS